MSCSTRTDVTLVTGFLGSGKTTVLNRLLRDRAFSDSAVIVNEFGDVGIDHHLVGSAKDVILLDSGCLCCLAGDSLGETLIDLYHRRSTGTVPAFSRVLIETSGLADPARIVQIVLENSVVSALFVLAGVICVVDALHGESELAKYIEAREQIAFADRVLFSKLDLFGGIVPGELESIVRSLNPTAEIVAMSPREKSPADLFRFDRDVAWGVREPGHHEHTLDLGSHAFRIQSEVTWAGIAAWTRHLTVRYGDGLLRCKALLRLRRQVGRVVVQGVHRTFVTAHHPDLECDDPTSPIVCIGRNLERSALRAGLSWLNAPEGSEYPASADFAPWDQILTVEAMQS